jgi:DNA polymerase I
VILTVGSDKRNRTLLSAFRARTSRNQPSNSRFIFGPSAWLRSLIKPPPNHAVVYLDWQQQEFGIAAALSGDTAMQAAYQSGDPYLMFGKQAGAIPAGATKSTHKAERELFKQCVLAVQYGMESEALASRIGRPAIIARDLLRRHRETYKTFWHWSDSAVDQAMLSGSISTVFGWHLHIVGKANPRSVRNFPMQANGAEMLRIACCLATERGVEICAPIHDAILICARLDSLENDIAITRTAMAEASCAVLSGFELGTDANVIRWPDRYVDPRGAVMWERVLKLLAQCHGGMAA